MTNKVDKNVLDTTLLQSILSEWSFWTQSPGSSFTRDVALPEKLHADLALIIQGVRRGGKSTLLTQLPERYGIPLTQCYFCNFEDPRLMNALSYELLDQIVSLAESNTSASIPCYFFFDEIQNVIGWEKWLHRKLERPHHFFVLTGSNSCLLSGEFSTTLTGRHISLELFPFSYHEYKTLFKEKTLLDYMLSGGFPRPLSYEHPTQLLQEYFNDIILRDILKRANARSADAIKQVVKMAFDTCGSELSYRKIAAITDLSVDTVKTYLETCENAYLLFSCPFFSFSEKKQLARQKKYYPIDTGLRYAISGNTQRDYGKSLEQLVFLTLKQHYGRVFYWQEIHQGEVDFVVMEGDKIIPYQVTGEQSKSRHEQALEQFYKQFPHAEEARFISNQNAEVFFMNTKHSALMSDKFIF